MSMSNTFADLPDVLTTDEVATIMRVAPRTIRNWARSGAVPTVIVARSIRIPRYAIAALLADPVAATLP